MPMMGYTSQTFSDPSALPAGVYPAFLLHVSEEPVPDGWAMKEKSDIMWRWYWALWASTAVVGQAPPELQSGVSSCTFSPGGRYQASKAYVWVKHMEGREIAQGERYDPNAHVPLPCMLTISRHNKKGEPMEHAIIKDLAPWREGATLLTPEFTAQLMAWWATKQHGNAEMPPVEQAPTPLPPPVEQPWMHREPPAAPVQAQTPPPAPPATARKGW